jgi:trehalose-phosphatase
MRYLLESWNAVGQRLRTAKTTALFLDFDGTLAPLRARPEEVRLPAPTRRVLQRLAWRQQMRVWVISGRRQADVSARVAAPGVRCLGLYGWENGGLPEIAGDTVEMLAEARSSLAERLDSTAGLWIEDKAATFALHFRRATPDAVQRGRTALDAVSGKFSRYLTVAEGNRVWEIMPRELRGKGDAVRRQLREIAPGALPVYIGDDAADESAFAALAHGITVCVGPARQTRAAFRLRNPWEVCRALQKLDGETR